MPLPDTFVRQAKYSGAKAGHKHSDSGGHYLLVTSAGKYWRVNYRFLGKQKTLALGVYPAVSLVAARKGRDRARCWPLVSTPAPRSRTPRVKRMQARGIMDSMRCVLGYIGKVFCMAMVAELADRAPTVGVADALEQRTEKHFAAITEPAKMAQLMRVIYAYEGHPVTCALKFAPLVFQRPHMVREAEWTEVDLDGAKWQIPAEKMKIENGHIVPLARQAVEIPRALQPITGHCRYVFASLRPGRPMSENTINMALRNMGYDGDTMVGHGFRAMARRILDEVLGERVDLIKHQLAHAVKDVNGRAYNRTAHLPARREIMQRWADYLDELRKLQMEFI
jgi:integrase